MTKWRDIQSDFSRVQSGALDISNVPAQLRWVSEGAVPRPLPLTMTRPAVGLQRDQTGDVVFESPTYRVEERVNEIELRCYEPYVVAETLVEGPLERAGNGGFRLLAGYISGGNKTTDGDSKNIAMTTSVAQDRVGDQYRVRFMMPTQYTVESLPTPNDSRVTISEVGPQCFAAIRYRGRWTRKGYERHCRNLTGAISQAGHTVLGEPVWARYDPPWTPWFLRRNEILVALDDQAFD